MVNCEAKKELSDLLDNYDLSKDTDFYKRLSNITNRLKLPEYLYKYRSFDAKEYGIKSIENKTIYMQYPTRFNDPYDCYFYYDHDILDSKVNSKTIIDNSLARYYYNNKTIEQLQECSTKNLISEETRKAVQKNNINSLREKLTVHCFAERHDNMLMWTHYASDHTGFCIQYKTDMFQPSSDIKGVLLPINYTHKLFDASLLVKSPEKYHVSHFWIPLLSKAKEWAYEEEWRYIISSGDKGNDQNIPAPQITAIYMGHHICEKNREFLSEICENEDYKLFEMDLEPSSYKMVANEW